MKKDKDADRQQAQIKRLKREVSRQQRGAVRELRKDAAFTHARRAEDVAAAAAEKAAERGKNRAWLETQQVGGRPSGMTCPRHTHDTSHIYDTVVRAIF